MTVTLRPEPACRVDPADLEGEAVRLPRGADRLAHEVGALARAYFGAIDAGDLPAMLSHLDPARFDIHVLAPDAHLTDAASYRAWHDGITAQFSRLRHTIVALDVALQGVGAAQARLSVHSEVDRRAPATGETPRANVTLDILWDLTRQPDGRWTIAAQRAAPDPTPAFSTVRAREFAVSYLHALDRRDLDAMLAVLAPPETLNIALNQGLIIKDFPAWFATIDETFVNSDHRVQGVVALDNPDGTIDAHLKIHFTADRRHPEAGEAPGVDFSVERIWTLRRDGCGAPQLVSQRPFAPFVLATSIDPRDVPAACAAIRAGETEAVRDWLRRGGDPNAYGPDGFTPFLAAAATGTAEILRMMLREGVGPHAPDPDRPLRDPDRPEAATGLLAAHLAAQGGSEAATLLLLARAPAQLHARIAVNGHTPLLQAAFYGHVPLAKAIVEAAPRLAADGGCRETVLRRLFAATTLRGLNATDLARQFGNEALVEALAPHDMATACEKHADTQALVQAIPAGPRHKEAGSPAQMASEAVIEAIAAGLAEMEAAGPECRETADRVAARVEVATCDPHFEPDRLAGPLLQTPLIAAVTGTDAHPGVARLRLRIVDVLLARGADPDREEAYPMAVDAVIRAAVFNHFAILERFAAAMDPEALARALNHRPAVNGLTALHDSVLRAATGAAGYLEQIRWARARGARADIPDHTGRTQRDFAAAAFDTDGQRENAPAVWRALMGETPPPRPYRVFGYDNLTFLTIPGHVADKGAVWRALSAPPDTIVRGIALAGPNAMAAEVVQAHGFGTALIDRHWPDGRPVEAREVQAFAAQTRGTPLLPIMCFSRPAPCIKQLLGAGLFGALLVDPEDAEAVRALMHDVYFPQRPSADVAALPSTAEHPLGRRAVGADNLAQRTFAEYARMMDCMNGFFLGGIAFRAPAAPAVLAELPALRQEGVRLIDIDRAAIRTAVACAEPGADAEARAKTAVAEIEDAARAAGIVLSGRFATEAEIAQAFRTGYRHIVTTSDRAARRVAWASWLPAGTDPADRVPLPREMPIRPPEPGGNDLRRALAAGELAVFGALTTPDLDTARALAGSGILNALAIEREHGTWSTEETLRHIAALRGRINVVVRLCSALDPAVEDFVRAGVTALIATAVRDAGEAEHFLQVLEAANIAVHGAGDRARWAVPVVMMETAGAARDTDRIVAMLKAHGGVCHPGPLDLSASLGAAWGTVAYESTLRRIEQTARAAGVPLAGVRNTLEEALADGMGMVLAPVGMDAGALNAGLAGTNPLQSLQGDNSA